MRGKTPILFLHGAFSGVEIWTRFVAPFFAARGHAVAVPRLPGALGDGRARLRDYVRTARSAADALGGAPLVVGHSLGGFVAQHLAAERRLAGLALIAAPGPLGLGPTLWKLASRPDVLASLLIAQAGGGALLGAEAARRALFTDETPESWIAEHAPQPTAESPAAILDGMSWDLPVWPLVRRTPCLALLGAEDAFVPRSDLRGIAALYGAETDLLEGMGHGAPIDPRWRRLAWRVAAWVDECAIAAIAPARVLPR